MGPASSAPGEVQRRPRGALEGVDVEDGVEAWLHGRCRIAQGAGAVKRRAERQPVHSMASSATVGLLGTTESRRALPWRAVSDLSLAAAVLFAAMALSRFRTWHNDTFNLAFYARLVWGAGHGDLWNPLVGAPLWGLHLSLILIPLGLLGRLVSVVPLLLVVQAAAVAAAGIPIARIASRRMATRRPPTSPSSSTSSSPPSAPSPAMSSTRARWRCCRSASRSTSSISAARSQASSPSASPPSAARTSPSAPPSPASPSPCIAPTAPSASPPSSASPPGSPSTSSSVAPHYLPRTGSLQLPLHGHLGSSPTAILAQLFRHPVAATLRDCASPRGACSTSPAFSRRSRCCRCCARGGFSPRSPPSGSTSCRSFPPRRRCTRTTAPSRCPSSWCRPSTAQPGSWPSAPCRPSATASSWPPPSPSPASRRSTALG